MKGYRKLTIGIVAGWFVLALASSAMGAYRNGSNRIGVGIAIAALTPLVMFGIWFRGSAGFRQFALSLDPRLLTSLQMGRIIGFAFVLLEAHSLLPALFAFPAGYGDMTIGLTACLIAWKSADPAHRGQFIRWQVLGITDLVLAVTLGTTIGLIAPHSIPMTLMTMLPLSLIPTFFVPLYTILHVICIAQARTWKAERQPTKRFATPLQQSAS